MHVTELLHTHLADAYPEIHAARLTCVIEAVKGLLHCQSLQLSAIGRHLGDNTTEKHSIKRIDRLLGNTHLAGERLHFYHWQAAQLIGKKKHPIVLLDFSDVDAGRTRFIFRAAIPMGGRAISLYEEVHRSENHPQRLARFLDALALILPLGCQPILVTDAGFRGTWRELVSERGWYYVSRQRNRDLVRLPSDTRWLPCKTLYAQASATPRYVGEIHICRNHPRATHAYLYLQPAKNRSGRTLAGRKDSSARSKKIAAGQQEPWLLLSNLPTKSRIAQKVVAIYQQRMQIEEAFRDLKSHRFGFAFRGNTCKCVYRLEALLLLASLAVFVAWLAGLLAVSKSQHWQLQANTIKSRNVLSIMTIGLRCLWRLKTLSHSDWHDALNLLHARAEHFDDL